MRARLVKRHFYRLAIHEHLDGVASDRLCLLQVHLHAAVRETRERRNAHARHPRPRHQDAADYQAATALEALMGYLYLSGQEERLLALFQISQQEDEACPR